MSACANKHVNVFAPSARAVLRVEACVLRNRTRILAHACGRARERLRARTLRRRMTSRRLWRCRGCRCATGTTPSCRPARAASAARRGR
eukprot:2977956-Pleurochrysis_carterae.AAC.1